jgi:hypothetical protein
MHACDVEVLRSFIVHCFVEATFWTLTIAEKTRFTRIASPLAIPGEEKSAEAYPPPASPGTASLFAPADRLDFEAVGIKDERAVKWRRIFGSGAC